MGMGLPRRDEYDAKPTERKTEYDYIVKDIRGPEKPKKTVGGMVSSIINFLLCRDGKEKSRKPTPEEQMDELVKGHGGG